MEPILAPERRTTWPYIAAALALLAVGGVLFFSSIYFAWLAVTPEVSKSMIDSLQTKSKIVGLLSVVLIAAGTTLVVLWIRRINRLHKPGGRDTKSLK